MLESCDFPLHLQDRERGVAVREEEQSHLLIPCREPVTSLKAEAVSFSFCTALSPECFKIDPFGQCTDFGIYSPRRQQSEALSVSTTFQNFSGCPI